MQFCVLRAPNGSADRLSSQQVDNYLDYMSSHDRQILKSISFVQHAEQALSKGGVVEGSCNGPMLQAALQASLDEILHWQDALKKEFSNENALEYAIQAFGRSTDGPNVACKDFVDFVRFCVAYRIHCYFESPKPVSSSLKKPQVVFALGGPGAGKGTQCAQIAPSFQYSHLSAGDLLREERQRPGSEYGSLIESYIKDGKLVPIEITVKLIKQAMEKLCWEGGKFLIDGFPRSMDNMDGWEKVIGDSAHVKFALYFDRTEGCMERRLIERGKTSGRSDDNPETIKKRFKTFQDESMPVLNYLEQKGLVRKIPGEQAIEEVWSSVRAAFGPSVVFVLGGPGAGKGTQCAKVSEAFGYVHLSAGDLLREERKRPGSDFGELIEGYIQEGKLVPVDITVKLLQQAMIKHGWEGGKYLIDGFPRSFDNMDGWNRVFGGQAIVQFALFIQCTESIMQERLLERGKTSGRSDDNIESIKKRFKTFQEESVPVRDHLSSQGLLKTVDGTQSIEAVWTSVQELFKSG